MEPIRDAGMTVLGNFYEYDAICAWLREHGIDPATGEMLPSLFVVRAPLPQSARQLALAREHMRAMTNLWAGHLHLLDASARLASVRNDEAHLRRGPAWTRFERAVQARWADTAGTSVLSSLMRDDGAVCTDFTSEPDTTLFRPDGAPGIGLAHVDLSSTDVRVHNGRQFKLASFDAASLRNQQFIRCSFARSSFVATDLRSTVFRHCDLSGGSEVCFAGAVADSDTTFAYCVLFAVGKDVHCTSVDQFRRTLVARGMSEGVAALVRIVLE